MVLNDEIMEGITDSGFEPAGITTRAQAAVALKRLLSKFEEKAAVRINRPYLLILKRVRFFYITSTKFSNSSVHAKASCDTMIESVF